MTSLVQPESGEILTRVPGPRSDFGPFATVDDAIFAACPLIMEQPQAVIPVPKWNDNFKLYWQSAREYCAWLYSVEGKDVEMSLFVVNAVQDDPIKHKCDLPPYVQDFRPGRIAYLVILHSHPFDERLSKEDVKFLFQMASLHGFTPSLNGQQISISIVAFFGREVGGKGTCAGFYQYSPIPESAVTRAVLDARTGHWRKELVGHFKWNTDGTYEFVR